MKKHLINFMFTVLTFGTMLSLNTMAAGTDTETQTETETGNNITISETGSITLESENAQQEGINAFQLSLKVKPETAADVAFSFNQENNIKITEYRYHANTNTLNIYVADEEPVFKGSDLMNIGEVTATDNDGNAVDFDICMKKNSLKLVSQNSLTETAFSAYGETMEDKDDDNVCEVRKTIPDSYQITIPESTDNLKAGDNFTVSAENVKIEYGTVLAVSVTSENTWHLMDRNTKNKSGIGYSMGYGDKQTAILSKTETILRIGDGEESGSVNLTVLSVDKPKLAGTFDDLLTFSVDLIE